MLKRFLGLDTRAERYAYASDPETGYVSAQKVAERWVPTTCGYCSVGCGMFVGVRDGRAVPAFISQALRNEDVTIFGDGSQTRSFTYITDLVDGIIKLMLSPENDPINIGNPREMTIKEIAETIIRMTGAKSRIIYKDLPVDDPKQRRPDITRARTLLGWEPKVDLEHGLVKTIDYFRTKVEPRG